MKEVKKLAETISSNLKVLELANGDNTRIVWKEEAPRELQDWFTDISGEYADHNLTELDEVYRVLEDVCCIISEIDTEEEFENHVQEYGWAYDYNADLLDWVKESLYRIADVDEALQEGSTDMIAAIQTAMHRTRSDMAYNFFAAMQEKTKR